MARLQEMEKRLEIVLQAIVLIDAFQMEHAIFAAYYPIRPRDAIYFLQLQSVIQILLHQESRRHMIQEKYLNASDVKNRVSTFRRENLKSIPRKYTSITYNMSISTFFLLRFKMVQAQVTELTLVTVRPTILLTSACLLELAMFVH